MPKRIKILFSAILSGLLIAVGGIVFSSFKETSLFGASFMFSIGLFTIIMTSLYLYTGKVGYVFENKGDYLVDLAICYVGNILGAVGGGYLIRLTRNIQAVNVATNLITEKNADSLLSLFILAVLCGMMIFLAVELNKRDMHSVLKMAAIFMCVMVFILAKFEHSIADMVYYSIANAWSWDAVVRILIISVGNGIGSIILYFLFKFAKI